VHPGSLWIPPRPWTSEYIPALQTAIGIKDGLNEGPDGHKDGSQRGISLLESKKLGCDT